MISLDAIRAGVSTFDQLPGTDPESPNAMEAVQEALLDSAASTAPEALPSIKLAAANTKWRALSCLQKAIRFGEPEIAVRMAAALINSEEGDHLIKRTMIIALEDVGFGDPVLVGEVVVFAASAKIRKALGGWPTFLGMVRRLAEAPKDRVANELAVAANANPALADDRRALYALAHEDLMAVAASPESHWQDAMTAMRCLSGAIKFDDDFAHDHRSSADFRAAFSEEPALIRYFAHRAMAAGGESTIYAAGMRVGWRLLFNHSDADPLTTTTEITDPERVKSMLLPALDAHTIEGRKAYGIVLKKPQSKPFRDWLDNLGVTDQTPAMILGMGVFIAEGKLCTPRVTSPDIAEIRRVSEVQQAARCCLPDSELGMLRSHVEDLLPAINEARAAVLGA